MPFVTEPYENVFIGNFLFGLGLAIGRRRGNESSPACVNLLQQTPLDPLLGDVLIELPGTLRLYEFKRSKNKEAKELAKSNDLRVALGPDPALLPVSREVHWFVRSMPIRGERPAPVKILPYIDLPASAVFRDTSLSHLIEELVNDAFRPQGTFLAPAVLARYLALVGVVQGGGAASGGGFLVHVDSYGCVRYAAINDMRELRLHQSKYVEAHARLAQQRVAENDRTHQRELNRDRSRGR